MIRVLQLKNIETDDRLGDHSFSPTEMDIKLKQKQTQKRVQTSEKKHTLQFYCSLQVHTKNKSEIKLGI